MVPRSRRQRLPRGSLRLDPNPSPGMRFSCCWTAAGIQGVKAGHGAPGGGQGWAGPAWLSNSSLPPHVPFSGSIAHLGAEPRPAQPSQHHQDTRTLPQRGIPPSASQATGCQKPPKSPEASVATRRAGHRLQTMQKRIYWNRPAQTKSCRAQLAIIT